VSTLQPDVTGRRDAAAAHSLVNLNEIAEIELFILKRMKEFTVGDHASVFHGAGFNFVGTRDWQPGDRMSSVDWAQSSLTNFSPMVTREFDQDSNATVMAVADASLSTRCGINGVTIASAIARSVAAAGLSAVFFQDQFGLITFDEQFHQLTAVRPRVGRSHVIYCLDLFEQRAALDPVADRDITATIAGHLRKASLVPVISDFLVPDAPRLVADLAKLNAVHDIFLLMTDVRFAYELPNLSAGWVEAFDIETGFTRVFSKRELRQMAARVDDWQQHIMQVAREHGLDVVRVGLDRWEMEAALVKFTAERRLRKM
jgi:uncharacterized protein (DUF58 family)